MARSFQCKIESRSRMRMPLVVEIEFESKAGETVKSDLTAVFRCRTLRELII